VDTTQKVSALDKRLAVYAELDSRRRASVEPKIQQATFQRLLQGLDRIAEAAMLVAIKRGDEAVNEINQQTIAAKRRLGLPITHDDRVRLPVSINDRINMKAQREYAAKMRREAKMEREYGGMREGPPGDWTIYGKCRCSCHSTQ